MVREQHNAGNIKWTRAATFFNSCAKAVAGQIGCEDCNPVECGVKK
jgi:hypothetical protein